jgi:glycosyltransferase involved in cell wall biosynthesis
LKRTNPILSIITVNFNDLSGLTKTYDSVCSQTSQEFEYLIIDGGSTDGSEVFVTQNKDSVAFTSSEKDNGIYDAQNKGIIQCKGRYLLFLNSGDTLYDKDVIKNFYCKLDVNKGIIYGNSIIISQDLSEKLLVPPSHLPLNFWYRNTLNHQAVFIKRELFDEFGLYNLNLRICADFEFFLKVFLKDSNLFQYIPITVCNYYEGGISANPANYDKMIAEKETVLKTNLSKKKYNQIRNSYISSLPLRKQVLSFIYKTPVISNVFKNLYPLISNPSKK